MNSTRNTLSATPKFWPDDWPFAAITRIETLEGETAALSRQNAELLEALHGALAFASATAAIRFPVGFEFVAEEAHRAESALLATSKAKE